MPSLIFKPQEDLNPTPALERRLEKQVFAPARSIGEELSLVSITDPPPPIKTIHPPQGGTWVAAYHDTDPVAQGRGDFLHAPENEIERLTRMFEAGVEPNAVLIGHQLPGRWRLGDPVPPAYLPGEASTASRVLAAQAGAVQVCLGLLRAAAKIGIGAAAAIGSVVLLDPFILGGVRDPQTGLIGWVALGGWDEEPAR